MYTYLAKYKYQLYLRYLQYLRYRIYYIKNATDIISIFRHINFLYFYKNITSDDITEILTDCFLYYPVTDLELQKFSILQQEYDNDLGIKNYATLMIWVSIIQSIQEKNTLLLIK